MPNASKAKTKLALKEIILASLAIIIVMVGLFASHVAGSKVEINDYSYKVEIADSLAERQQGLSGRDSLPDGTGMLFIFEEPAVHGFWMKDMNFSIDMIWIAGNGEIEHIEKSVSPNSYPEVFYPNLPASYVLEVPAGDSMKYGFEVGDKAVINL